MISGEFSAREQRTPAYEVSDGDASERSDALLYPGFQCVGDTTVEDPLPDQYFRKTVETSSALEAVPSPYEVDIHDTPGGALEGATEVAPPVEEDPIGAQIATLFTPSDIMPVLHERARLRTADLSTEIPIALDGLPGMAECNDQYNDQLISNRAASAELLSVMGNPQPSDVAEDKKQYTSWHMAGHRLEDGSVVSLAHKVSATMSGGYLAGSRYGYGRDALSVATYVLYDTPAGWSHSQGHQLTGVLHGKGISNVDVSVQSISEDELRPSPFTSLVASAVGEINEQALAVAVEPWAQQLAQVPPPKQSVPVERLGLQRENFFTELLTTTSEDPATIKRLLQGAYKCDVKSGLAGILAQPTRDLSSLLKDYDLTPRYRWLLQNAQEIAADIANMRAQAVREGAVPLLAARIAEEHHKTERLIKMADMLFSMENITPYAPRTV